MKIIFLFVFSISMFNFETYLFAVSIWLFNLWWGEIGLLFNLSKLSLDKLEQKPTPSLLSQCTIIVWKCPQQMVVHGMVTKVVSPHVTWSILCHGINWDRQRVKILPTTIYSVKSVWCLSKIGSQRKMPKANPNISHSYVCQIS